MNRDAKNVVELAKRLGFTYEGYAGSGHVILNHPKAGKVIIAGTGSEPRGYANTIARLERLSGQKLPRIVKNRSRKPRQTSGFTMQRAVREQAAWQETVGDLSKDLHARRDQLIGQCRSLARNRGSLREIPPLLNQIAELESRLRMHNIPVIPFDPYTLGDL